MKPHLCQIITPTSRNQRLAGVSPASEGLNWVRRVSTLHQIHFPPLSECRVCMLVLLCWLLSRVEFRNGMWTAHPDLGSFYLLTSKEQGRTDLLRQEKCSLSPPPFITHQGCLAEDIQQQTHSGNANKRSHQYTTLLICVHTAIHIYTSCM